MGNSPPTGILNGIELLASPLRHGSIVDRQIGFVKLEAISN
jgi:hypothetical protein